jgi:hypothetical protein
LNVIGDKTFSLIFDLNMVIPNWDSFILGTGYIIRQFAFLLKKGKLKLWAKEACLDLFPPNGECGACDPDCLKEKADLITAREKRGHKKDKQDYDDEQKPLGNRRNKSFCFHRACLPFDLAVIVSQARPGAQCSPSAKIAFFEASRRDGTRRLHGEFRNHLTAERY